MTAAQLLTSVFEKYADTIPKPQLTTSNVGGGINAFTPKTQSLGSPAGGLNASPIKPMTTGINPPAGLKPPAPAPATAAQPTPQPQQPQQPLTNADWTRFYSSPEGHVPGMKFRSLPDGSMSFDVSGGMQHTDTTTPLVSPPAPSITPTTPAAQPAPAQPQQPQMAGTTQPQPIVSNTQGTMTDTSGQPVATTPPQPKGPEAFVDAMKARSGGKEPQGPVIDMTKPLDVNTVAGHFKDPNLTSEQKTQLATDLTTKLKTENPQYYEGFQDIQAGRTDTEAAKAYQGRLAQAKDEFVQQQVQADPQKASTPQGFGEIVNNAMSTFQNMPMPMQAMVGIGLPVGLIGIMSSMFGGGGMGMGILGALGLGAGVLGGAAGGMFGQGAQNMAADAAYQMGSFLGMAPAASEGSLNALKGEDAIQRLTAGPSEADQMAAAKDPAGHAKKVQQQLDQAGQVKKLMAMPEGMRPQFLRNIDPSLSEEEAVIAARNAAQMATQMDDPNSAMSRTMQQGQEFVANPQGVVNQKGDEMVRGYLPQWAHGAAPFIRRQYQYWNSMPYEEEKTSMHINKLIEKWAFNDMDAKELSDLKAEKAKGAPYRVDDARREHELNLRSQAKASAEEEPPMRVKKIVVMCVKRASRCWAGYEPVPGKKPYSNDSCRPVGSGKKKKTDKKKSAK